MIRTPLGLKRFVGKASRLQAAYSARRAAWERDHPKVKISDLPAPRELTIDELKRPGGGG